MMRYFTRDEGDLIELMPKPATQTVYKHTWREQDGFQWTSYSMKRAYSRHESGSELLAVEEVEGVVMEAAE